MGILEQEQDWFPPRQGFQLIKQDRQSSSPLLCWAEGQRGIVLLSVRRETGKE